MRFKKGQQSPEVEFQMAPMIDIVFLLLSFFVFASAGKIVETMIGVGMRASGGTEVSEEAKQEFKDEVVIVVLQDGGIAVNQQQYDNPGSKDLPELSAMLGALLQTYGAEQEVIIRGDSQVWHGRIVDVLNACAGAGVKRISFYSS